MHESWLRQCCCYLFCAFISTLPCSRRAIGGAGGAARSAGWPGGPGISCSIILSYIYDL